MLVLLAVGLILVPIIIFAAMLLNSFPHLGIYACSILVFLQWEFPVTPTLATTAGLEVRIEDVLSVLFVLASLIRSARTRIVPVLPGMLIAGSFAWSLLTGIASFGPGAVNEAREFIWLAALFLWLSACDFDGPFRLRVARSLVVGLLICFAYHVALYGLGTADSFVTTASGLTRTGRPITSDQALILAAASLIVLVGFPAGRQGSFDRLLGVSGIGAVLLAQHRSVWIATGLAAVVLLFSLSGLRRSRLVVAGLVSGFVSFLAFVLGLLGGVTGGLLHAGASTGTWRARSDTWVTLIDASLRKGADSVLLGQPFGSGYDRVSLATGEFLTFPPHNWYVTIFLRLGVFGLGCFIVFLFWHLRELHGAGESVGLSVLVLFSCYIWFYAAPWFVPLLLLARGFNPNSTIAASWPRSCRIVTPSSDSSLPVWPRGRTNGPKVGGSLDSPSWPVQPSS